MDIIENAYRVMQDACGIREGDTVRISRKAESGEMGWNESWTAGMSSLVGAIGKVCSVDDNYGVRVKCESVPLWCPPVLWFPFFVLEKIKDGNKVEITCEGKTVEISRESAKALNLI